MNILQSLTDYYGRLLEQEELTVPRYPYSFEKISFCILLSGKGGIKNIQVQDLRQMSANGPKPSQHVVPWSPIRARNIQPAFLWDKTAYVFGVKPKSNTNRIPCPAAEEHSAFKEFHRRILVGTHDEGLQAFLDFLDNWEPDNYNSICHAQDMLGTNVMFQLASDERQYLHDRPAAKRLWEGVADQDQQDIGRCLITGKDASIARLHRPVRGVKDANPSGAHIVSFNKDSFASYGKKQGHNAPISNRAAFAYTTVLSLLASSSSHSIQVGDTTMVFWADVPKVESMILSFLNPPPPGDDVVAAQVRDKLEQIAQGRLPEDIDSELDPSARYYILGLSPNKARLSIRFWQQGSFGGFSDRFCEHWRDLRIIPSFGQELLSVRALVDETAKSGGRAIGRQKKKSDKVSPLLAGETIRAIITGQRYPRSLFSAIMMRIRADRVINPRRAAILKACLVRDSRIKQELSPEDCLMSLNRDNTNSAYRLGRLFALLEKIQLEAMDRKNVNATIRDRFYASASATPARTFPVIMRIAMFHLAKLRKQKAGLAYFFEEEVEQVFNDLDSSFPKSFDLDDQGRFVIGYYHQRFTSAQSATREHASDSVNSNKE